MAEFTGGWPDLRDRRNLILDEVKGEGTEANVIQLVRPINQINKIEFDSHGSWIVYLYLRWEMALGVNPREL